MTTAKPRLIANPLPAEPPFWLPDPLEIRQDEKTAYANHLSRTGNAHHLYHYLGALETTVVGSLLYLVTAPTHNPVGSHYPDLLVAWDVDDAAYWRSNGYIISEQGKPPDFVLEIASESSGKIDVTTKRVDYAAMGIREYWRFDKTGEHHGVRLAGDRLSGGIYRPIPIDCLAGGILQGHSLALNLLLRWERGYLGWHETATEQHIPTFSSERARNERERARRIRAEARVERARAACIRVGLVERDDAEARADRERAEREYAEARADRERAEQAERDLFANERGYRERAAARRRELEAERATARRRELEAERAAARRNS